jgi:hypothetical protein
MGAGSRSAPVLIGATPVYHLPYCIFWTSHIRLAESFLALLFAFYSRSVSCFHRSAPSFSLFKPLQPAAIHGIRFNLQNMYLE